VQVSAESCDLLEPAKAHRGNSEPLFLLYRVKHLTFGSISGAVAACTNFLTTVSHLAKFPLSQVPSLQNGNLKHKVEGADTPLLSSQVLQLTPITADTDDLAVSGVINDIFHS